MTKLNPFERYSIISGQHAPEMLKDETLSSIFRQTVFHFGNQPAVKFEDCVLNYHELDRLTEKLASALMMYGIGHGARVGICMERSISLHASILAVIKTGAAWVPIDTATPLDRLIAICSDAAVVALIVDKEVHLIQGHVQTKVISYTHLESDLERFPNPPVHIGPQPDDTAYLIYTSGSTGKPKGIEITHRNICHFIRAENSILKITQADIVWQGFSPSFDMWLEEVAISWLVGAYIKIGSRLVMQELDLLPSRITSEKITVLHCVPSLLAVLETDMPLLRLINLGGEACQEHLVAQWWRTNRRMFNTYGPTETTVSATIAELFPGNAITIGLPLPNYQAYIVDEQMQPVPVGSIGELIIGGPGVSTGYVGRPDLTIEKFLPNTLDPTLANSSQIYKTGDAASVDANGHILFHGRLDDQVKIRGYRIELGEVESVLANRKDVRSVAVVIRKDCTGQDQLTAFIVPEFEHANAATIRQDLSSSLPCYMVPTVIKFLDIMPRLSSGKIDRKNLPESLHLQPEADRDIVLSRTVAEEYVVSICAKLFSGRAISVEDDFFKDLGGHSLLVAALVSMLRKEPRYRVISIGDIYRAQTIAQIALRIEAIDHEAATNPVQAQPMGQAISPIRYWLCGVAQALVLPFIFTLIAYEFLGPYLIQSAAVRSGLGLWTSYGLALLVFVCITPALMLLSVATKWLLLGRIQEGDHPLWGFYYFKWWLVHSLMKLVPITLLAGTPLHSIYLRLLGAKIGQDVYLGSIDINVPDLVEIGSHASFGSHVSLLTARIENGMLKLRRIKIGDHAYIGSSSLLVGGSRIEAWGELGNLSLLPEGETLSSRQIWRGIPAKFVQEAQAEKIPKEPTIGYRILFNTLQTVLLLVFPIMMLLPLVPVLMSISAIQQHFHQQIFPLIISLPLLGTLYICLFAFQIWALRHLILGRITPGTYSTWSLFYLRKWLLDQILELSLIVLHPLYASLYLPPWLRMLGAKIGQRAEVSTASSITPDLLELGDETFIADLVVLGDNHIRHGEIILKQTSIGRRSFVGNCSVIPDGTQLPSDVLIGCLTTAESEELNGISTDSTWFGSPALLVPKREELIGFEEALTYHPSKLRVLGRLIVEGSRIILPSTFMLAAGIAIVTQTDRIVLVSGPIPAFLALPFLYIFIMSLPAYILTVILKWILVGRYRPVAAPMWTWFVWISEAVTTTYESLASPLLLEFLTGTPFISSALRLLGVKVGRRAFINTTDITEFDCVSIGDEAILDMDAGPQTHLFEDRIMKIGTVVIGNRAEIGAQSIALYGSIIEDGARLAPLSIVMKGETLPTETSWIGSPARPL